MRDLIDRVKAVLESTEYLTGWEREILEKFVDDEPDYLPGKVRRILHSHSDRLASDQPRNAEQ